MNLRIVYLILPVAWCLSPIASHACPVCIGSTPYEAGLYWSALFLALIPFMIAATLVMWFRRSNRA